MMVPDSVAALNGAAMSTVNKLDPHFVMAQLESFSLKKAETGGETASSKELSTAVDVSEANKSLVEFAFSGDILNTKKMMQLLADTNIPVWAKSLTEVMKCFNKNKAYSDSVELFNKLDSAFGVPHPDGFAWACLIGAKAGLGDLEEAIRVKKHLEKSGVVLVAEMYNPILLGLMRAGRHDDVFDYWVEMKCNGINPNRESYDIMIEQCEVRGQPERAFFLLDEMRLAEVKPELSTFVHIFRACASAPHWVNGYQDIIFDGMAAMEGQELMPNSDVYNSILYAFARAGDGVAADFYLQEMKKKQIRPTETTYNYVITAYAK
jgi:pentatricopeptide repeat protein